MFENDWDQLSIDNGDAVNSVVAGSFDVVHYANDNVFQSQASLTHANKPTTVAVIFVAIIAIAVFIILISVAVIVSVFQLSLLLLYSDQSIDLSGMLYCTSLLQSFQF